MKYYKRLLISPLLVSVIFFTSCSGQTNTQKVNTALNKQDRVAATGETVAAIDTSIWYIFQDRNNSYWFGSNGQGVYRHDASTGQTKKFTHFTKRDGLCNDQIRGIQEDQHGNIYFNTVGGVSKFDGRTFTTLNPVRSNAPDSGWAAQPSDMWFTGAQDSGVVYRYGGTVLHRLQFPKTKEGEAHVLKYPRAQYPNMTFSPYDVYSIYKDSKGNMWFGTNIGVCRYDGKHFDWMNEKELGIDAIAIHVRSTVEDRNGDFWFGNTMHRFKIHTNNNNSSGHVSYKKERGIVESKDDDAAYFMSGIEDNKGDLWLATYNKGVWRYDGKKMKQCTVKTGDKNVTLVNIYKDKQGDLWLGTHTDGVYKFNGREFERFGS